MMHGMNLGEEIHHVFPPFSRFIHLAFGGLLVSLDTLTSHMCGLLLDRQFWIKFWEKKLKDKVRAEKKVCKRKEQIEGKSVGRR
jgi:hypothetical protein